MKRYTVEITDEALQDMEQIYNHIAWKLLSPENVYNNSVATIWHQKISKSE